MYTFYITVQHLIYMTVVKPCQKLSHIALGEERKSEIIYLIITLLFHQKNLICQ